MKNFSKNFTADKFFTLLLVLFIVVYYAFRPRELLILIIVVAFVAILFWAKWQLGIALFNAKKTKSLIIITIIVYLVFSFFNTRIYSYDGLNFHIKVALLVKDKGFVSTAQTSVKPYLGEYILGKIWSYLGLRFVNLTFGLWALLSASLVYKFMKYFSKDKSLLRKSFLLFITSQPFLAFSLIEFKIDLLLLSLVTLSFIAFAELVVNKKTHAVFVQSIFLGVAVIVKASILPLVVVMSFLSGYILYKILNIKKLLSALFISGFILCLPLFMWTAVFGATLPQFERSINVTPFFMQAINGEHISLSVNNDVMNSCYKQKLNKDYSSFIYGARSPLVLIQPFYYLTRLHAYPFSSQGMANPGPFIYFGLFIFPFGIIIFNKYKFKPLHSYFYIIGFVNLVVFWAAVSSIYWYVLYLFPLASLFTVVFIAKIENKGIRYFCNLILLSSCLWNVVILVMVSFYNFKPITSFTKQSLKATYIENLFKFNKQLEKFSKDSYILDASEHRDFILFAFMKDSDVKVIKSNYHFVSSEKSMPEMRDELLKNNIRYITVNSRAFVSTWYEGCPLKNNEILKDFLSIYTVRVYPDLDSSETLSIYRIL